MLALSVFNALTDAVAQVAKSRRRPSLHAPATPESILNAVQALQNRVATNNE
jgi:xanthine dehydrogenase large subunit